jgi:alpha-maltose-1-phosphate synthase
LSNIHLGKMRFWRAPLPATPLWLQVEKARCLPLDKIGSIADMQITQAVCGVFHHFDLANQLECMGYLKRIYSTFPWIRLRREGVPRERVRTFPWIHGPWMASRKYIGAPEGLSKEIQLLNVRLFDAWITQKIEDCDAVIALSGSGLKAGRVVQGRGGKYVCDRGSSHIRYQRTILDEEYGRWGVHKEKVDPRTVAREEAEYEQADAIIVPSEFARRTFIKMGIEPGKLEKIPYGVRLDRFRKTGEPPADSFNVLFAGTVSIRKGVPYLLEAFAKFKHPSKRLRLAGPVEPEMNSLFSRFDMTDVDVVGRQTQGELARWMNTSHVMVLPSVEDGFGLVMAQAMACGAPVIASENTGGPDLFTEGLEGFTVPIRSPETICERFTQLADDPNLQQRMSEAALTRVHSLGGWNDYGSRMAAFLKNLIGQA